MFNKFSPSARKQRGSALIISLLILVLLLVISTSSMQTTTLEEKMAGNARDQNTAFQAGESGLRRGEWDVERNRPNVNAFTFTVPNPPVCNGGGDPLKKGLCPFPRTTVPWLWNNWDEDNTQDAKARIYGQTYGLMATITGMTGVAKQPRYIMEINNDPARIVVGKTYDQPVLYIVSTQGYGAANNSTDPTDPDPIARSMVQSVYR